MEMFDFIAVFLTEPERNPEEILRSKNIYLGKKDKNIKSQNFQTCY
jgi:hypothetical protein